MQGFKPRGKREEGSRQQQVIKDRANNGTQSNKKKQKPTNPRAFGSAGLIRGPGTGTSDDIEATMPAGSYVMPADSTEQIGSEALASLGSPADVNVSNGEYEMPPEQVHAVGAQFLDTIKDQTHTPAAKGFRPDISRNGEQFFSNGGVTLGDEEAKRRAALKAPVGIGLTPEQLDANRRQAGRENAAKAINQTKGNVSGAIGQATTSAYNSAMTIPRTIANTTFDDRLPGQADRDAKRAVADKARASQWATANPEKAQQAGLGMRELAGRATSGVKIPPQPLQGLGGAPMPAPQQASAALPTPQLAQQIDQQPQVDPIADQEITNQPANEPIQNRRDADITKQNGQPDLNTGYVQRTDQERRDFARSNKVGGVPTLTSEMAKTIDPNSINTMSSKGMMGLLGSQSNQAVSQALKAAADRGDWGAVENHYAKQSGSPYGSQGFSSGGGQGFTRVKDETRMPSNAELVNSRLDARQQQAGLQARGLQAQERRLDMAEASQIQDRQWAEEDRTFAAEDRELKTESRNKIMALQDRMNDETLSDSERQEAYRQYLSLAASPESQVKAQGDMALQQQRQAESDRKSSDSQQRARASLYPKYIEAMQMVKPEDRVSFEDWAAPVLESGQATQGQSKQKLPAVGETRGQYRFKGGNPADQNNWEKI